MLKSNDPRSKSSDGKSVGGSVLNVTRKNFAVIGSKEMVCSVAPPFGSDATTR